MTTFQNLEEFFLDKEYKVIIAADAEPFVHKLDKNNDMVVEIPAGGVAVAFDPLARASKATYVGRGKTKEDKEVLDKTGKVKSPDGTYQLKRLFFSPNDTYDYYFGFSNQTLWPLCHVAFERPIFSNSWYQGYERVNQRFAQAIKEEIKGLPAGRQGKTLVWLNDYQFSLVPKYLGHPKDAIIALFWHIPWPTWEIFRILPQKKEILESLLLCDCIAFHRGYQARNFLQCVERELEARIDLETNKVYYKKHVTTVKNFPMGIDTDIIKSLVNVEPSSTLVSNIIKQTLGTPKSEESLVDKVFQDQKVILGTDRIDYTKGILLRLQALDLFFGKYQQYKGKVSYVGIMAPSRSEIPSYIALKDQMISLAKTINDKYSTPNWQPIHLVTGVFSRREIVNAYRKASVCLVTPLDDGMNLVAKEFVMASVFSDNPGMLVLSQFAGAAIDLTSSVIVNPYNIENTAEAVKKALEMSPKEKKERISAMATILDERNVYNWAMNFITEAEHAARENRALRLS